MEDNLLQNRIEVKTEGVLRDVPLCISHLNLHGGHQEAPLHLQLGVGIRKVTGLSLWT